MSLDDFPMRTRMEGGISLRVCTALSTNLVMIPTSQSRMKRAMMEEAILKMSMLMSPTLKLMPVRTSFRGFSQPSCCRKKRLSMPKPMSFGMSLPLENDTANL